MSGIQIGAHVSTSGGVHHAPERGAAIGAACIQVFTRNQMTWAGKPLSEAEQSGFSASCARHGIHTVMSHDSYLINLASPDPEKHEKSVAAFEAEIVRCDRLGIGLLNFHPGAHMGEGIENGLRTLIDTLNGICRRHAGSRVTLVLETVAGQGSTLGRSFEELARILGGMDAPERFGVCADTAHIFAAGYDFRDEAGWERTLEAFDRTIGLEWLRAFHVNDSKAALGSNVDRHALIGRGHIGPGAFIRLVTDPRTRQVPMFLETPAGAAGYAREITWLNGAARGEAGALPEITETRTGY